MIFEKIKEAKKAEEGFEEMKSGMIEYKQKIVNALSNGGIPDPEIPFILAALKLTIEDIEAIINRKQPKEKERMYGCCENVCEICRSVISVVTTQREVKGD